MEQTFDRILLKTRILSRRKRKKFKYPQVRGLNSAIANLSEGKAIFGVWSSTRNLRNARIIGRANVDKVIYDSEHQPFDIHNFHQFLMNLKGTDGKFKVTPLFKGLIGDRGYRKYLKIDRDHIVIDQKKIEKEARFDGKWMLRTNRDLPPETVALKYKELWQVEQVFRDMKSIWETRPIYHQMDETIRGHVFCSFLALGLRRVRIA